MAITYSNCTECFELTQELKRLQRGRKIMRDIGFGIAVAAIWMSCAFASYYTGRIGIYWGAVFGTFAIAMAWAWHPPKG